ncbi:DUF799 domain-containing protein [Chitinivorax sp. B]|uniref:DUF799 domain-containing protein n=1 Tax=Chitinivorax sp. B TaxID=2502235 RepID=UPI0010F6F44D|nr:DUF799 domain-containing protein [Chitinivorax sp. B]
MHLSTLKGLAIALAITLLASGCANLQPYDYSAYKQSNPKSVLILPPVNNTPDIKATYGMLSQMSKPLAEAGYYVFPVAVMDETFKQNGLSNAGDIHAVPAAKLREIFGADAALYVNVRRYGAVYAILSSDVTVTADARLVDLKTGQLLWNGSASASSAEQQNNSGGGLLGALITAAVKQVVSNLTDDSYRYAGMTSERLLSPRPNGVLYGPRSPQFGLDGAPR